MTPVPVVLLAGTAIHERAAPMMYARARRYFHDLHILALPHSGIRSMEATYVHLEQKLDAIFGQGPGVVIGHSQGGLHAAAYAANRPNITLAVAMNSPFHGTNLAYLARLAPGFIRRRAPALHDCEPSSTFLSGLDAQLESVKSRLVCVWSTVDPLVWPGRSACVEGALENIVLPATYNHFTEVLCARMWQRLADWSETAQSAQVVAIPAQRQSPENQLQLA